MTDTASHDQLTKANDRITALEKANAQLEAGVETAKQEVGTIRRKLDSISERTAEENKTDWRLVVSMIGCLAGVVYFLAGAREAGEQKMLVEVNEAKTAAASAKSAAGSAESAAKEYVDQEIEHLEGLISGLQVDQMTGSAKRESDIALLMQRVPSQSEWDAHASRSLGLEKDVKKLLIDGREREGKIDRSLLLISKNEQALQSEIGTIRLAQAKVQEQQASALAQIGSMRSGIMGAITEIEAQFRGTTAYLNTRLSSHYTLFGMLWPEVMSQDLPDQGYYPDNIPAQAFIEIGQVNGSH